MSTTAIPLAVPTRPPGASLTRRRPAGPFSSYETTGRGGQAFTAGNPGAAERSAANRRGQRTTTILPSARTTTSLMCLRWARSAWLSCARSRRRFGRESRAPLREWTVPSDTPIGFLHSAHQSSLRLQAGLVDDGLELGDLRLGEGGELIDRHGADIGALLQQLLLDLGLVQDLVDLGVEPRDDLLRRAARGEEALP